MTEESSTHSLGAQRGVSRRRRWLVVALLLSLLINVAVSLYLSAFANEKASNNDEPESLEPPPSWFDQAERDWLYHAPFKMNMRMLWVDCNRIVSAAKGEGQTAFDEIEVSARGIQRRAAEMESLWESVGSRLQDVNDASQEEDWLLTFEEYKGLWNACNDCHRYTWSPAYSHVTGAMLDAWLEGEHRPKMENEVDALPPPMIPNRRIMQDMNVTTYGLEKGIATRNPARVKFEIRKLHEEVKIRLTLWKSIAERAAKIVELSQNDETQGIKEAYTSIVGNCQTCHVRTVGEPRQIMQPMEWK